MFQIVVHDICLNSKPCTSWMGDLWCFSIRVCSVYEFTELCVSILRLAAIVSQLIFLKKNNVNLMFTINNSTYIIF